MSYTVSFVQFPETKVAAIEHRGSPDEEHATAMKLVAWRIRNRLSAEDHRSYGVHFTDPHTVEPSQHRVDFCVSVNEPVISNPEGVIPKTIPSNRCAVARYLGSRANNLAAVYLWEQWLPSSGERPGGFPMFFHYVNVGPNVKEFEMVTDVYLPLFSVEAPESGTGAA
jgi:AraC family transcriptional regulator